MIRMLNRRVRRSRFASCVKNSNLAPFFRLIIKSIVKIQVLCVANRFTFFILHKIPDNSPEYRKKSDFSPTIIDNTLLFTTISKAFLCVESKAVYQAGGELIRGSVLDRQYAKNVFNSPEFISRDIVTSKTLKKAVYGGVIFDHYGHFLTESISRLWVLDSLPDAEEYSVVFFLRLNKKRFIDELEKPLKKLIFEINKKNKIYFLNEPLRVENLVLPDVSWIDSGYAHSKHIRATRELGKRVISIKSGSDYKEKKIYLSRRMLDSSEYGLFLEERSLEVALENQGFHVVFPERLALQDQIKIFEEAAVIIGVCGSAFHTILLAQKVRGRIIYLCKEGAYVNPNFVNVDSLANVDAYYLSCLRISSVGFKPLLYHNLDETLAALKEIGI